MNAAVCACGRRIERDERTAIAPDVSWLRTGTHDPDECSRNIGYQGRIEGRREMALAAIDHLSQRRTLGGAELAEIRTNLLDLVTAIPLASASTLV